MAAGGQSGGDTLSVARETIARQADEIARLRRDLADERFARELRDALTVAKTVGTVAAPVSHDRLLELIVGTATQVLSARGASLFVIDEETQELVFEVALGEHAVDVGKFRVPLGHGVAGLVAVTGHPLAVSDAESDLRQAAAISEQMGYRPQSLLCVPLFYGHRIIGVLELVDKEGAPAFAPKDMELLGLFAHLAGAAIEQSRTHQDLTVLVQQVVHSLGGNSKEERHELLRGARDFARHTQQTDASYNQALEIARLVHEIVAHGGETSRAVQTILRGFADYLQSQPHPAAMATGQ